METTIRGYLQKDLQAITYLFNEVVEDGNAFLSENKYSLEEMERRITPEGPCFVSITNSEISGCYILKPNSKGRGSHIANATYFVSKTYRGKGIGKLLGEHSITKARDKRYKAMQFNSVVSTNS